MKSADHFEDVREGASPRHTAFITTKEEQSAKGFFPSASSISEMPRAHTSLLSSDFPSYTSGAMYHDVPQLVLLLEQE